MEIIQDRKKVILWQFLFNYFFDPVGDLFWRVVPRRNVTPKSIVNDWETSPAVQAHLRSCHTNDVCMFRTLWIDVRIERDLCGINRDEKLPPWIPGHSVFPASRS